jgi:signal recognition particle GTPase
MPVGPISAPIVSVFPDELETALLEENVSLKVTDKISQTFFALLS